MNRPKLTSVPLPENIFSWIGKPGKIVVTMSINQWDQTLYNYYQLGAYLLELDRNENPVGLYKKEVNG